MNEPESKNVNVPTDSESQPELREWVTPTFEAFQLKEAFAGYSYTFNYSDGLTGSS